VRNLRCNPAYPYPSFSCEFSRLIGGLDPNRTISVVLDVGTNNESLLKDPLYLVSRLELSHLKVNKCTYGPTSRAGEKSVLVGMPTTNLSTSQLSFSLFSSFSNNFVHVGSSNSYGSTFRTLSSILRILELPTLIGF